MIAARLGRIVTAVVLAATLASCGGDDLEGTVTAKTVNPGFFWTYFMPTYTTTCSGTGTTRVCTQTQSGTIPIVYWIPECREVTVEGPESGSTCLDSDAWDRIEVGDSYVGPDVDPKDRKQERDRG